MFLGLIEFPSNGISLSNGITKKIYNFIDGGEMDKDEITAIHAKLNKLEQHIINLIIPIQAITTVLRDSKSIGQMIALLGKPLTVEDGFFKSLLVKITQSVCEFKEASEKLDIVQTLSEIKYIGSRLN